MKSEVLAALSLDAQHSAEKLLGAQLLCADLFQKKRLAAVASKHCSHAPPKLSC
jgi:hypothetical protein